MRKPAVLGDVCTAGSLLTGRWDTSTGAPHQRHSHTCVGLTFRGTVTSVVTVTTSHFLPCASTVLGTTQLSLRCILLASTIRSCPHPCFPQEEAPAGSCSAPAQCLTLAKEAASRVWGSHPAWGPCHHELLSLS